MKRKERLNGLMEMGERIDTGNGGCRKREKRGRERGVTGIISKEEIE